MEITAARKGRRHHAWAVVGGVAAALLLSGLAAGVFQWSRPYPLPQIPPSLTLARAGLVFDREHATVEATQTQQIPVGIAGWEQYRRAGAAEGEPDVALAFLKAALAQDPRNLVYGNTLRQELVRLHRWTELLSVWDEITPAVPEIRLQKALAKVDAMENTDLADAGIGKLSIRSMGELGAILAADPYNWLARYSRGLNNLYWPVTLRRVDKALADLGYCVAVVEALHLRDPWLAIAYEAYGDALVKAGRDDEGVRVWQTGLQRFPESRGLTDRVQAGTRGAYELVRRVRGTDSITRPAAGVADLSLIWDGSRP